VEAGEGEIALATSGSPVFLARLATFDRKNHYFSSVRGMREPNSRKAIRASGWGGTV